MKRLAVWILSGMAFPWLASANLLTNGSFETPEATVDYAGSGWTAGGSKTTERQWWATRTGGVSTNKGGTVPGWDGPGDVSVSQDVPVSAGTYTFQIWARNEDAYTALTNTLRIEWFDGNTNLLQSSEENYEALLSDDAWHPLYLTDTCSSSALAFARVSYVAVFGAPGVGGQAAFFDDASFYAGTLAAPSLANPSFERPTIDSDNYWRSSQWNKTPENTVVFLENWANRSGGWGVGVWGWDAAAESNDVSIFQNVPAGPGTYSFAVNVQRETSFLLSNAQLRIEWYDGTFTNKVADDSVTNIVVPNDWSWHEFSVAGTCLSNELREARVSLWLEWWANTNEGLGKALKVDDARLLPGVYNGASLDEAWIYHAGVGYQPSVEALPGTNVGSFLAVDYASKTSTFYVVTPADGFATYEGEGGVAGMRTSWQRPENGQYETAFADMEWVSTFEVPSGSPFHGLPAAGVQTQILWRHTMEFPRDTNGVYYTTNTLTVFYSPYVRTTNALGGETDRRYLVRQAGATTNDLGQIFDEVPENRDYSFLLHPPTYGSLTNVGFEDPAAGDFTDAKWTGFGSVARDVWAARSGARGGYFSSWAAGSGGFFQDVAATGGTYTFSLWMKRSLGANINNLEAKIEWFNSASQLMFAETNTIVLPADELWHRVYVTSTLPAGEALFIRPVVFADFGNGSYPFHEVLTFDDAELYQGGFTSVHTLANADFETGGTGFAGGYWDAVVSDWVGRDSWAARTGSWGADFQGFQTNNLTYEGTLSQGLNVSTGAYEFGLWILVEDSILLTNLELRIQWLDEDFAPVQADSVQKLAPLLDNNWYYYSVTGTCDVATLFEVRPMVFGQWDRNLAGGNKALKMDDAFFGAPLGGDSDGDGLPDAWEALYFGGATNADANANSDGDAALNWEEYVADTNPTNSLSSFPNAVTNVSGTSVLVLFAGPPTTNSRAYDVWWSTNLVNGDWTPMGYNLPGQADGSALPLTVTNDAPVRNYRTGVRLP